MTTVRDIAREAGVSAMTVSNVINGRYDKVSAATVRRVREIMDRRGFVPSASARALSRNSSNIVALVYQAEPAVSDPLGNPHDAAFVGEVERETSRSGRYLMIRAAENVVKTAVNLKSWRVDGAIFLGTIGDEVDELREHYDIPMVFVDNYSSSPEVYNVGIDDFRGGYLAGQHLLAAGHETFAFVGPEIDSAGVIRERYNGFSTAISEAGYAPGGITVIRCLPHFLEGLETARRLAGDPARPTGIFTTADIIAIGLLKGFLTSGVRVPQDVSLIGFDDMEETTHVMPSVSTIRQNVAAKARAAVQTLLGLIEGGSETLARRITLDVELVERETVGPPHQR